ncbi:hypothetical protein AX16_008076 [Volvariella volvacea WC 439]|nr:hypothetical protein AX16_008076 [Volvariella volvacea WC 439]
MSHEIAFIVDDQDGDIEYLCPVLHQSVAGTYINNTWTSPERRSCISNGWFRYRFIGTRLQAAVESSTSYEIEIDRKSVGMHSGYYVSPQLADDEHTVVFYAPSEFSLFSATLDYLTISAGSKTPLHGRTIIVNDNDDAISYNGDWTTESPAPLPPFSTHSYESTAHWTSTVGSMIEFRFTGESIAVFGIFANLGTPSQNVTATYILDDASITQGLPAGAPEAVPKVQLFRSQDLPAGEHRLLVNISDITPPQAIGFDFFLYNTTVRDVYNVPTDDTYARVGFVTGAALGGLLISGILLLALWHWTRQKHVKYA